MAQTNFTPILTYKSDTATSVPSAGNLTNSANGAELAVNTADKRLFTKDSGGNVVEVGTNPSSLTLPNSTANGVFYSNGSKVVTSGSALTFDGSNLVNGGNFSTGTSGLATYFRASGTAYTQIGDNQTLGAGTAFVIGSSTPYLAGNVGGSEGMRLTSTGLGIGTSSPAAKLHIGGNTASTQQAIFTTGVTDSDFKVVARNGVSGATAVQGYIGLDYANGTWPLLAGMQFIRNSTSGELAFTAGATTSASEQMRLTSTGLGIGTSSPTNTLSVSGSANITGNTTLGDATTDTVTVNGYMGVGGAASASRAIYVQSTALTGSTQSGVFSNVTGSSAATSNIDAFRGTPASAAAAFTVANMSGLRLTDATKGAGSTITSQRGILIDDQTQGTNNYGIDSQVSSGTNKWNIYSSGTANNYFAGDVGIGTSSPAAKLDVTANAVVMGYFRSSGGSANDQRLTFTSGGGRIVLDAATNSTGASSAFAFTLGGTEGMRLTTTGLGIGTSSPSTALYVKRTSGNSGIYTDYNGTNVGRIEAASNGNLYIGITTGSGDLSIGNTANANAIQLLSSGNLGLGVTPSAWTSGARVLQFPNTGSIGTEANGYLTSIVNARESSSNAWSYLLTGAGASKFKIDYGSFAWYTAPSGTAGNAISFTQAMTLDASGNLGVGATSLGTIRLNVRGDASTNTAGIKISHPSNASNGFELGYLSSFSSNDVSIYNWENGFMRFATNGTERARIDSSGNLLVGTTGGSGAWKLYAVSGATQSACLFENPATSGQTVGKFTRTASDGTAIAFSRGGSDVGTISITTTATAYNTSSDYRLKNTIAPMTGALAKVALLKPCTYKWNADGSDGEGFIAHELAEVCPHAVTGEKDAVNEDGTPKYQGIDTSFLVATLTAAIQELKAEFDAYKASHP